ncbi:mechanosensitive ion channel domain-containing protein [Halarcobacter sp.]|uniref:mechanosensitive ion channel family protein n=1 Tax=Halarcobacter sp. TaxID=2321133 RepID=UPI002AA840F1|nr:mechanosensitive ion channel domain-containing protein [Halarcobacter sp.]
MQNFFKFFIFFIFIPSYLFSAQTLFTGNIEKAKEEIQTTQEKINEQSIDQKVNEQIKIAQDVIKNINEEVYLLKEFQNKDYNTRINYLENRINLNQKEDNNLAIKRDEIELQLLRQQALYESTLKDLVDARKSFKDKEYFIQVLDNNIEYLLKNSFEKFRMFYEEEKNNDNRISKELTENYLKLLNQYIQQLFTLRYLKDNINQYRTTNFFIDNFNLQYIISTIDSYKFISSLSKFTSYHFKITIGEIVIVLLVLLFFKLFVTKVISIFISLLNKIFIEKYRDEDDEEEENKEILEYIENSIRKPLVIALYTLSIHISLYILVKDTLLLNKVVPWINTFYIALLTWAIYALLSNSITSFAQHLVEKYPNVRREMIVFILRILKVIFILLVILFLFTQLGIDIKAIAASLGVGGIAIALASKDTLANFFGSLNIMSDNSFSQGDWILANDVEGTIVDIRMRTTRIRTFDNAMITIPNSELANTHIKNYSKRRIGRRIKMTLNITYESSIEDIYNLKKDIYEMLINHAGIASERTIKERRTRRFEAIKREDLNGVKRNLMVYIDEYGSSSINIFIYCFSRSPDWEDWLEVKEDLIIKINKLVKENNCDFAYPTQTLFMKND